MNLFIDTHLNDIVLISFDNDNKIIKEKIVKDEKQNSKLLMPLIKKLLDKNTPESIIIVNGPGSFTGVRLGVTVAKSLAHTLNIPIRTITSLECMAVSLQDDVSKIVSFSDNNGYYVGIFNKDMSLVGDYAYIKNNDYNEFIKKHNVNDNVNIDYKKVISYAMTKETQNAHEVNPIYVKKIDVENDKTSY